MGLTDSQHAKLQQGLKPIVKEEQAEKQGDTVEDATIGNTEILRGIPAVGRVSGTMRGTRPGIDGLPGLEDAGTLILQGLLKRTRRKDHE